MGKFKNFFNKNTCLKISKIKKKHVKINVNMNARKMFAIKMNHCYHKDISNSENRVQNVSGSCRKQNVSLRSRNTLTCVTMRVE